MARSLTLVFRDASDVEIDPATLVAGQTASVELVAGEDTPSTRSWRFDATVKYGIQTVRVEKPIGPVEYGAFVPSNYSLSISNPIGGPALENLSRREGTNIWDFTVPATIPQ